MVRGQHSNGGRMQAQSVPYDTILLHAVAIGTLINESKSPAHRGRRWRRTARTERRQRLHEQRTVTVQVLLQPIKPRYSIGQPTTRPAMGIVCLRQKSVQDAMRRE